MLAFRSLSMREASWMLLFIVDVKKSMQTMFDDRSQYSFVNDHFTFSVYM